MLVLYVDGGKEATITLNELLINDQQHDEEEGDLDSQSVQDLIMGVPPAYDPEATDLAMGVPPDARSVPGNDESVPYGMSLQDGSLGVAG